MSARNIGRISWWLVVLVSLIVSGLALWRQKPPHVIYLDETPLLVEVAASEKAWKQGLSGRTGLAQDHGMLFDFDGKTTQSCIWMKDMKFNIDAYWFDENSRLISYKTNLSPASFPAIYCPDLPASYLLEVPAGQFAIPPKQLKQ